MQARQGSTKIWGEIERLFIEVQIFGSNAVLRSIYDFKIKGRDASKTCKASILHRARTSVRNQVKAQGLCVWRCIYNFKIKGRDTNVARLDKYLG